MSIKNINPLFLLLISLSFFASSCSISNGAIDVSLETKSGKQKLVMSEVEVPKVENESQLRILKPNAPKINYPPTRFIIRGSKDTDFIVVMFKRDDLNKADKVIRTLNQVTVDSSGKVKKLAVILNPISWEAGYYALVHQAEAGQVPQVWCFELVK